MQILFKYSFFVEGKHGLTGKKSHPLNEWIFGMILPLLLSHGRSSVYYFLHFPNSLHLPRICKMNDKKKKKNKKLWKHEWKKKLGGEKKKNNSVKWPTPLLSLSPVRPQWSFLLHRSGAEKFYSVKVTFFASCALYCFRLRVKLSSHAAEFWVCDQNRAG